MGYETRLIFFAHYPRTPPRGYQQAFAEIELYKTGSDALQALLKRTRCTPTAEEKDLFGELDALWQKSSAADAGLITMEDREYRRMFAIEKKLNKKYPYLYRGNEMCYKDAYGDLLHIVSLKEARAVLQAMVTEGKDPERQLDSALYAPYQYALRLMESIETNEYGEHTHVIFWGH